MDGQTEGQSYERSHEGSYPTRKTTKEVSDQTLLDNFKHCKIYLLEIDMIQRGQDVAYVRSLRSQV